MGKWAILSLEKKSRFVPLRLPAPLLTRLAQKTNIIKAFDSRKNLSDNLSRLLLLKQNEIQEANEQGLHSKQSRQIYICSVMQSARVQEENMPRDKNNRKSFPFNSLLSKLNSIILGQYLIKTDMCISPQDVTEIQSTDPYLNEIRTRLGDNYETKSVNNHFVLHKDLLFRNSLVLG